MICISKQKVGDFKFQIKLIGITANTGVGKGAR